MADARSPVPSRIYLTGFMASGKTAVGSALAARLGHRFVDLDREVEARAGASVGEIFARRGEAAFRDLERRALEATAAVREVVIATGGGAVVDPRNRALLRRLGVSVWLDPGFETLVARLDAEGLARRPLFRDREQAAKLYEERLAAYAEADLRIEIAAHETVREVAARIARSFEGALCGT